jgi:molybdopterin molybdotransferase
MISVKEAISHIFKLIPLTQEEFVPLTESLNRVLAEPIIADREYPPFNRACMDGVAFASTQWNKGVKTYSLENIVKAGDPLYSPKSKNNAIEIMTGAACPPEFDVVVRIEDCEIQHQQVTINLDNIKPWQNIHLAGTDYSQGANLLSPNTFVRSTEMAILASVGAHQVKVKKNLKTAVISTGDELVDVAATPQVHQIRKSNVYQIQAAWQDNNLGDVDLYHLRDDKEVLEEELQKIISHYDVVLLSGGVSMGKFDFIPEVLEKIGVQKQFHKVAQKPGKPMWFGNGQNGQIVFGLPGNPVSTAICLTRYVLPAMQQASGRTISKQYFPLAKECKGLNRLAYFLPVRKIIRDHKVLLEPVLTKGSGDFTSLSQSDGFVELEPGNKVYAPNISLEFFPW